MADFLSGRREPFETHLFWYGPNIGPPVTAYEEVEGTITLEVWHGNNAAYEYHLTFTFPSPDASAVGWYAFWADPRSRRFAWEPGLDYQAYVYACIEAWRGALLAGAFNLLQWRGSVEFINFDWPHLNLLWLLVIHRAVSGGDILLDITGETWQGPGEEQGPNTFGKDVWSWEQSVDELTNVNALHALADGLRRGIAGDRAQVARHDGRVLLEMPALGQTPSDLPRIPTIDGAIARVAQGLQTWNSHRIVLRGRKDEQVDVTSGFLIPGGEDE